MDKLINTYRVSIYSIKRIVYALVVTNGAVVVVIIIDMIYFSYVEFYVFLVLEI